MPADVHRARYSFPKLGKHSYAVLMKTINNSLILESSDAAAFRLHVLDLYYHHGWRAAVAAFKIGKSTLYDWKKAYEQAQKKTAALIPVSTRPLTRRAMQTDYRIVAFIEAMRHEHGSVSKYKLKVFLDEYCKTLGVTTISATTIGKIIKRKRFFFQPKKRISRKRQLFIKRLKQAPKEKLPGYIEMDSLILNVLGKRWCFMTAIDVVTKTALAHTVPSLASIHARELLIAYWKLYPVRVMQTDNGSEFLGAFHDYLGEHSVSHQFIYPHSPRINGVVERFNRTIQEEFMNRSDEIFYDPTRFKEKLQKYLIWYNTKRPHLSLKLKTPIEYLKQLTSIPECG